MSWVPSSRPPLPPRPLSTYPSADYDKQQQQQQSNEGRSSRQSIGSPPSMDYNFQPMGYTSPTPPHQFQQSSYQQQSQQYTQYQPQQAPQPGYIWNQRSVSDSNRASYAHSPAVSLPNPQQYQSPIPGSYPHTGYHSPRLHSIDTNPSFPISASAPALPTPRRSLPSPIIPTRMGSPPLSHMPHPSSSSVTSSTSTTSAVAPPSTAALPTTDGLTLTLPTLDTRSDIEQVLWAQDVIRVLERHLDPAGTTIGMPAVEVPTPSTRIPTRLAALVDRAAPIIISNTSHRNNHISSLATYLRGKLLASGSCEDYLPRDPRQAFKDFETAARGGEIRAWYRLGRDYETVGDMGRAKDCFQRGQEKGDCEATYRMGMAYLLGQINLNPDAYAALALLRTAYKSSTIDCPQPAYVYGMLLAGEMEVATEIPYSLVLPQNTHDTAALSSQLAQAREALERAAYLCLPQAQYKCGWMYEHASYGCAYDPLMSVQWYSLASQGGEVEADMALSKWFLCGAEGHFGKNEKLARTFAEKAARKGHQNGSFAMGYYYELGIGGRKDREQATKWYDKAARLGNQEAIERMKALAQPNPHYLSVQEHEKHLNNTLVRTRTDAASRSGQRGDRQNRRRDQAERERMMIEADRAARQQYNPMSPIPEMMSPSPGSYPAPMAFPARPTPYQSFAAPVSIPNIERPSPAPGAQTRRFSQVPTSQGQGQGGMSLPSPVKAGAGQGSGSQGGPQKGPKTFAEMGIQSKPVEGEGCLIM